MRKKVTAEVALQERERERGIGLPTLHIIQRGKHT